jgi:hypothetical protein
MFASNSRYYKLGTYSVTLANGQIAIATLLPKPPTSPVPLSGYYTVRQNDRLDTIAAQYLTDATLFWQLSNANNSPSPAALIARPLVGIPRGGQGGGQS